MVDKDLLSIQEARSLVRGARKAQAEFVLLGQDRVDAIVKAIADAAAPRRRRWARWPWKRRDSERFRTRRPRTSLPAKSFTKPSRI